MNYHIMIQDKFLDTFIEDIYAIGEEKNNTFWFRGNPAMNDYIQTKRAVNYIGNDRHDIIKKIQTSIKPEDNIFVHYYDLFIGDVLIDLPNKIYVFIFGSEFYMEPKWFHFKWLYDKKTSNYMKQLYKPKVNYNYGFKELISSMLKRIKYQFKIPNDKKLYSQKLDQVRRIDYLIIPEYDNSDIVKIKSLYPKSSFETLFASYDLNFDIAKDISQREPNEVLNILVGNSGAPTNNHLEAFLKLKNVKAEIYCPLSYGWEGYTQFIIKKGNDIFGKRFHPIIDYKSRTEYVEFLNEMDIVFMFHNRQQAWGNIATCITLGKPVFLKSKNPIFDFFKAMEIKCYDAENVEDLYLRESIKIEKEQRSNNHTKLKSHLSMAKRHRDLKSIMLSTRKKN